MVLALLDLFAKDTQGFNDCQHLSSCKLQANCSATFSESSSLRTSVKGRVLALETQMSIPLLSIIHFDFCLKVLILPEAEVLV